MFSFVILQCVNIFISLSIMFHFDIQHWNENKWGKIKLEYWKKEIWYDWKISSIQSIKNSLIGVIIFFIMFHGNNKSGLLLLKHPIYVLLYYILSEMYYFSVHRLFHIFSISHLKKHTTEYLVSGNFWNCHWLEHLVLNMGSIFIPMSFFDISYIDCAIIYNLFLFFKILKHSGYRGISDRYFIHKNLNHYNYGLFSYFFDRLFGTYK